MATQSNPKENMKAKLNQVDNLSDVLVTVYAHSIYGKDIQIRLSPAIFLDEQSEAIGDVVIRAWKSLVGLSNG